MTSPCFFRYSPSSLPCKGPVAHEWVIVNGDGYLVRIPICDSHGPDGHDSDIDRETVTVRPGLSDEEVRDLLLVNRVIKS
jgi:hypothetical protein